MDNGPPACNCCVQSHIEILQGNLYCVRETVPWYRKLRCSSMLAYDPGMDRVRRTALLRIILKRPGYPCCGLSDPTSLTGRLGQDRLSKGWIVRPTKSSPPSNFFQNWWNTSTRLKNFSSPFLRHDRARWRDVNKVLTSYIMPYTERFAYSGLQRTTTSQAGLDTAFNFPQ